MPTDKIIPEIKLLTDNMIANMEAAHQGCDLFNLPNTIFVCIRQKANGTEYGYVDGDYKYSIAALPFGSEDLMTVETHGFDKIPAIFFNAKRDLIETFVKILKNLAFS
jgi:hypothetical protein